MNNKNIKTIYFFLKSKLLKSIIDTSINKLNDISIIVNFSVLDSEIFLKEKLEILIIDRSGYDYLRNKKLLSQIKKVYLLNDKQPIINDKYDSQIVNIETPFSLYELVNQVINDYSQIYNEMKTEYNFNNYKYSYSLRKLSNDYNSLRLTEKENDIFNYLINSKDSYSSKENLLENIWNYADNIDTHTVETHIYVLRKKIEKVLGIKNIINYEKLGYCINKTLL